MASCRVEGLDDVIRALDKLGRDADKIAQEALLEGGQVLTNNTRSAIHAAANKGYATGALAASTIPTAPTKNSWGWFVAVRPVGTDSKGVRNGLKWGVLNSKTGFKDSAVAASESQCKAIAERVLEEHAKI